MIEFIKKHEKFKKYSWLCWLTPAIILFFAIVFTVGIMFDGANQYSTALVFYICGAIGVYISIGFWIAGAIKTIKGYGGKAFWLGITYPFWSLPYLIHRNIRFSKTCPPEVRNAYAETEAKVPKIKISIKRIEKIENKIKEYERVKKNIQDTYSALGEKEVEKRLSKIRKPSSVLKIDHNKYEVIDVWMSNLTYTVKMYLREIGEGNVNEKILINNYFLFINDSRRLAGEWKIIRTDYRIS